MSRACAVMLLAACGSGAASSPSDAPQAGSDLDGSTMPTHLVTYVSGYGPDIAWFDFDTTSGALTLAASLAAAQPQPSFLAFTGDHLYAVSESGNRVAAYAIDPATGALRFINDVDSGGTGPAHISVDRAGKFVLAANYGNGNIAVFPIRADGGVSAASQSLTAGVNAHMILTDPGNHHVFVPCKGSDYVAQYNFDPATGTLTPNAVPQLATDSGAGPRHLAFAPDGTHAFLITENASTLTSLGYDATTGQLTPLHTVSTRAANATGSNTGAEVWVHPGGNFVYASNRGDDNISVFTISASFELTLASQTSTGGHTPRDFALDPTGHWLIAANQDSSSVTTFAISLATGALSPVGAPISQAMPAFVGFLALPAP